MSERVESTRQPIAAAQGAAREELARLLDTIRPEAARTRILPRLVLLVLIVGVTIVGWQVSQGWQRARVQDSLNRLKDVIEARWSGTNLRWFGPARSVCDEIERNTVRTASEFAAHINSLRQAQDVYEGVFWISPAGNLIASSAGEENDATSIWPPGTDATTWRQLHTASRGGPLAGPVYEGNFGRALVLLYYPLAPDCGGGGVAAVLRMSRLFEQFADGDLRDLVSLDIYRNDQLIYRTGEYLLDRNSQISSVARLRVFDQKWVCTLTPTARFLRQYETQTPYVILVSGVLGTAITCLSLLGSMKRRWQYMILARGHLQVFEIISEMSRAVSLHRGEAQQSLARLLETARPLTGADSAGVYRLTQDRRELELICSSGYSSLVRLVELNRPVADPLRVVLDGRSLAHDQPRSAVTAAMSLFSQDTMRGGAIVPLQFERVVGVMVLCCRSNAVWSEGRTALARMWGTQAASILADESMHEQMRDALTVQEKLARRRELMLTALGEIYQAGTVEQTLGRIAQLSPQALGIEACIVMLRTRRENELEIVAATGELGARHFGLRIPLSGEQFVQVFKTDAVPVLAPNDLEKAGFVTIAQPWLAGLAVIPMMHSDGKPIGCIALLSAGQVAFTSDQLDLARVLSSRAAAAIENAHLNQQIRRDSETRAMLLRELNHRVKNNLAGIVGLLAMSSQMEMPANVRQWLDRVIERIGNIARAHEMFSGGGQTVSLAQLVDQVIPSLAVVKPAGVNIVKELGPKEIWLKTTQAVSLAMVIHELCYNAIVHGLGSRGTLTIRAHLNEQSNIVVDIIDDGTASSAPKEFEGEGAVATMAPPATSTGLGLRLVKGLVGRELRGRFVMRRRAEGGTVVTVEFPMERERE